MGCRCNKDFVCRPCADRLTNIVEETGELLRKVNDINCCLRARVEALQMEVARLTEGQLFEAPESPLFDGGNNA